MDARPFEQPDFDNQLLERPALNFMWIGPAEYDPMATTKRPSSIEREMLDRIINIEQMICDLLNRVPERDESHIAAPLGTPVIASTARAMDDKAGDRPEQTAKIKCTICNGHGDLGNFGEYRCYECKGTGILS